jgi:GrpB-like predicted nucleotidyltransferase (UPF0157 family)
MARQVVLEPYSPQWPALFESVRQELDGAFGGLALGIEHVGSTSIPGLAAKPIVDVLLGAASLADIESRFNALARLGYEYIPQFEAELPLRRFFKRRTPPERACHLHAVTLGSDFWRDQLVFRDTLRANPALAAEYGALKQHLAVQFRDDASRYTDAKSPFIRGVVAAATRGASARG